MVESFLRLKIQNIEIINSDEEPPENTISVSSFFPSLKCMWIDGTNFRCLTKTDGYTWVNHVMKARVSPMQQSSLESTISTGKVTEWGINAC